MELQLLLFKYQVTPKVLVDKNKGPNSILEELEALIRICRAGFILATPDDEGRLRGSKDPLNSPRARERGFRNRPAVRQIPGIRTRRAIVESADCSCRPI